MEYYTISEQDILNISQIPAMRFQNPLIGLLQDYLLCTVQLHLYETQSLDLIAARLLFLCQIFRKALFFSASVSDLYSSFVTSIDLNQQHSLRTDSLSFLPKTLLFGNDSRIGVSSNTILLSFRSIVIYLS